MMASMTMLDTAAQPQAAQNAHDTTSLIADLSNGTPYAIAFGGQGSLWLQSLSDIVRQFGVERELVDLVQRSNDLLAPLASELARGPATFDVLSWVDSLAMGESAENLDLDPVPAAEVLRAPAQSVPGIALTQLLGLAVLERQGSRSEPFQPRQRSSLWRIRGVSRRRHRAAGPW